MDLPDLIDRYESGLTSLKERLGQITDEWWDAVPVAGTWSLRQLVCHLADFEPVYADRMKRVIAEDNPTLPDGKQDAFAAVLAYDKRDPATELQLMECVRRQMATILREQPEEAFQRTGVHAADGPLTLEDLLERITGHIDHHLQFVDAKLAVLRKA